MTEVPRIARFGKGEARFLDVLRERALSAVAENRGSAAFIHSQDEKGSTELESCQLAEGVRATVQRIGPVEHITVWEESRPEEPLIEAERHADAYLVHSHQPRPWEGKFYKLANGAKLTSK